jgi:hypothetical protein
MNRLRAFARFWWEFLVGDDVWMTAGLLVALTATALLRHTGMSAWWLVPAAAAGLLGWSLRRATRGR